MTDASGERRFLAADSSTLAAAAAASLRNRPVDMGSGSSSGADARASAGPRGPTDAGPVSHEPSGVLYAPPPAKLGVIIPPGHSLLAIHDRGVVTCCVPRRVPTHCGVAARGVPAGTLGGVAASGGGAGVPKPPKEGVEGVAGGTCARKEGRMRGSNVASRSVEARREKKSRESQPSRRRAPGREGGARAWRLDSGVAPSSALGPGSFVADEAMPFARLASPRATRVGRWRLPARGG